MDAKTRRGCLWAALGGMLALVMVGIALLAGGAWFVYQSFGLRTEAARPAEAAREFDALRARFAGQSPLLELDASGEPVVRAPGRRASAEIATIHLVAWDAREGRLARIQVPFWLVAWSDTGTVRLGDGVEHVPDVQLQVRDLRDAGPGLILDHTDEHRRVLVWAE